MPLWSHGGRSWSLSAANELCIEWTGTPLQEIGQGVQPTGDLDRVGLRCEQQRRGYLAASGSGSAFGDLAQGRKRQNGRAWFSELAPGTSRKGIIGRVCCSEVI